MSQAAQRTLELLELVARSDAPLRLMEIAARAGQDKTTCARLLGLLVARGWLLRDPDTKKYSVGPTLIGISMSAGLPDSLRIQVFSLLHDLRERTNETVSLQRRFGNLRLCVAGMESREDLRRGLPVGDALPLTAGPSGKVILAFTPDALACDLAEGLDPEAQDRLWRHLGAVRESGYLSTDGDRTPGVGAISVPLFDRAGIYGSLTVAGPSSRFDAARRQAVVPVLLAAGRNFTAILGGDVSRYARWMSTPRMDGPS